MIRRALGLAALLAAGCGGGFADPCAGQGGTCIALTVTSATVAEVDTLRITAFGGSRESTIGKLSPLPIHLAIISPGSATGQATIVVDGLVAGQRVGSGQGSVLLVDGAHVSLTIDLVAPGPSDGGSDAPIPDAGGGDARSDGGGSDGGGQDGGGDGGQDGGAIDATVDATCTDVMNDVNNCGVCGKVCTFANATARCVLGKCTLGACDPGYRDCLGGPNDGCETYVQGADRNNCGGCGIICGFANATPVCTAGFCKIGACNAGYGDCDNNLANGCETRIAASDPKNCGACGIACPLGQVCATNVCRENQVTCTTVGIMCAQPNCSEAGRYSVTPDIVVDLKNARRLWQRIPQPPITYSQAQNFCTNLRLGGLAGWRLPTYPELAAILYQAGGLMGCPTCSPAIDQAAFPGVPSGELFWTTLLYMAGPPALYQTVNFCDGRQKYPNDITTPTSTRCTHDPI